MLFESCVAARRKKREKEGKDFFAKRNFICLGGDSVDARMDLV